MKSNAYHQLCLGLYIVISSLNWLMDGIMISIEGARNSSFSVNVFWLRDHCRCEECWNLVTKQRKHNLLDIPENIKVIQHITKDGIVAVNWSDGHQSKYSVDFLYNEQLQHWINRSQKSTIRTLWDQSIIVLANKDKLRITLPDLVKFDANVKKVVQSLICYGIAFIDEVPPNPTMTEMAIRRIFPLMKTFFGEMYTFSDQELSHADTAYTKDYLGSHTDNTYFCDAAGLQALHCIQHTNGTGGENFFVDGLKAAEMLRKRNPNAFDLLSKVHVPAEYIEEGQHHKHSAPIIRLDPVTKEIVQLRLNIYDRAVFNTLPQENMAEFYAAFREFLAIVQDDSNRWTFKLNPGTVVIFDNWRIFHGREAYTGARTMTGAYVQRTDYLSKARVLGIIE